MGRRRLALRLEFGSSFGNELVVNSLWSAWVMQSPAINLKVILILRYMWRDDRYQD